MAADLGLKIATGIVAAVAIAAAAYLAASVLAPLVLALFIIAVVWPLQDRGLLGGERQYIAEAKPTVGN